ncbi:hypothetical protein MFIFM68171_10173 [Madurella fahalii]|uniref:Uncharacterized protein n=1 Tax=Madurella fahalii TaxID=1157608 RepID=A0ABQ0GQD6_9PEZI
MDKVKDTMRKGFEKATRINEEPVQEQRKDTLQTTWPTQEHHTSMTGGIDSHLGKASHTSDTTGPTGKASLGQPSSKP